MARSLNRVQLIGNLTRDPELRYTPTGTAVCSFGLATNRSWTTDTGDKHDETEFHKIVSWNKLAELCSQFLTKGRKVYVEGRLSTRQWTGQDGQQRSSTEVVIDDMILLDYKKQGDEVHNKVETSPVIPAKAGIQEETGPASRLMTKDKPEKKAKKEEKVKEPVTDEVLPDDIPF